jgi:hypothetical protein
MRSVTEARHTVRGVTAWNEMRILIERGAEGEHLVGFGPLTLVFERSDEPWEHLRLTFASPGALLTLQDDGWVVVGSWGLFTYLKRPRRHRTG